MSKAKSKEQIDEAKPFIRVTLVDEKLIQQKDDYQFDTQFANSNLTKIKYGWLKERCFDYKTAPYIADLIIDGEYVETIGLDQKLHDDLLSGAA